MIALLAAEILGYVSIFAMVAFFIAAIVMIVAVNRNWPEDPQ